MNIWVWHGTSTTHRADIVRQGLRDPYVTDDPVRARYYAAEEAESGGEPLVLDFAVESGALRYDDAAMNEPVLAELADRDAAWDQAQAEHPEWLSGSPRSLRIPPQAWQVSWAGVGSARIAGTIPARLIHGL